MRSLFLLQAGLEPKSLSTGIMACLAEQLSPRPSAVASQ